MLIRNYGLFWRRDNVHIGAGKNAGHLKGYRANGKTAGEVDFREQQGVYVLYDDNFRIVYVGQSGAKNDRLFNRIKRHTSDQLAARWTKFSWFGVREVNYDKNELTTELAEFKTDINGLLNHIEAILITAAEPPNNRQGGRFGTDVEQFLQYRDEVNLGPTPDRMLKDLQETRAGQVTGAHVRDVSNAPTIAFFVPPMPNGQSHHVISRGQSPKFYRPEDLKDKGPGSVDHESDSVSGRPGSSKKETRRVHSSGETRKPG